MSAEELAREVWRRWNEGERDPDPALFTEDIEIHSALAQAVYKGYDGVAAWTAEIDEQFEQWELGIEGFDELGPDRVVAHGWIKLRGRGSGLEMKQGASWLVAARDGRIASVRNYVGADSAAAAAAAGEGAGP